jgi:signal peptidase II
MKWTRILRLLIILSLVMTNVGCDQLSKSVVREKIAYHETIELIGDNLILMKVENTGAFLGLGSTLHPLLKNLLLLTLPAIVLIMMLGIVVLNAQLPKEVIFGLTCIIGGGVGNVLDRITYGSVTDFMHLDFGIIRTGIFNMADVSILMGTLCIFIYSLTQRRLLHTE